jgi:hypothetical protein
MADSLVETVASSSHLVNLNTINQITAEIHVESHLQASPPPVPSSPSTSNDGGKKLKKDNQHDSEEPEAKRKKPNQKSMAIVEKLEMRLGGILCCAVCLDLPRTAMYQVIFCSISNLRYFGRF